MPPRQLQLRPDCLPLCGSAVRQRLAGSRRVLPGSTRHSSHVWRSVRASGSPASHVRITRDRQRPRDCNVPAALFGSQTDNLPMECL